MVTPGLYGFVGATKWLTKLTATTYAADKAYWTERDWVDRRHRQDPGADRHARAAWRPPRPARSPSAASPGPSAAASRRSRCASTTARGRRPPSARTAAPTTGASGSGCGRPSRGRHDLTVRATDGTGEVQTDERAEPFPERRLRLALDRRPRLLTSATRLAGSPAWRACTRSPPAGPGSRRRTSGRAAPGSLFTVRPQLPVGP